MTKIIRRISILSVGLVALAASLAIPAKADDLGPTLEKVKETKVLTLGARESTIPFSYLNDQQEPVGFSMDLCDKIGEAVRKSLNLDKIDVKRMIVDNTTRIPLIVNGTIDLSCDAATNTLERQKQVDFALTHYLAAGRLMVKKSSGIKSLSDLKGKTVVSTAGTTNLNLIIKLNKERDLGMNVISAKDNGESFLMLETGRAVAYAMDDVLAASAAANSKEPTEYGFTDDILSVEPYGIIIRRNDPQFKKVVDDALRELYTSGEASKIYEKWFQQPIPPKGANLSLPMSDALAKQYRTPVDSADPAAYKM